MTTENNEFPIFTSYAEFEKHHFAAAIEIVRSRRLNEKLVNKKIGQHFRTIRENWAVFQDQQETLIADLTAILEQKSA